MFRVTGKIAAGASCDFVECCAVSQPTISHHLRVLREAGVIRGERQGSFIFYALVEDFALRWRDIGQTLSGLLAVA